MERKQAEQGSNVKSSFISQKSPQQKQRGAQLTSRKQLSSSTFFDIDQPKPSNTKRLCKDPELLKKAQQTLTRARSLKNIEEPKFRSMQVIEGEQLDAINQNTLRLRSEELLFKLKVRLGSLLRELGCGEETLSRFSQLGKVDQLVLFVSQRAREALNEANKVATNTSTSTNKDREALQQALTQQKQLKEKLAEKENGQRQLKGRLKEAHLELKQLYDQVNVKEKEYSQRTSELYQARIQMKEHQKTAEQLRQRSQALQKERNQLKTMLDNAIKDQTSVLQSIKKQNQQLSQLLSDTKEQLDCSQQRCNKLQELNDHLKEQLTRWRQRLEFPHQHQSEREKSSEEGAKTPNDLVGTPQYDMKKSTMSMNGYANSFNNSVRVQSLTSLEIDNTKLRLQLTQITKQNEELQRSLLNYAPNKLKYQQTLQNTQVTQDLTGGLDQRKLDFLKERSGELYKLEIEGHYKRKAEQIAREWKDKLFDIVCKYQDQAESMRTQMTELKEELQQMGKKLFTVANQKYLAETKLIELQRDLYSLKVGSTKSLLSHQHPEDQPESKSQEIILLNPQLLPIQEEDSPKKRPEDKTEETSVFTPVQKLIKEDNQK